MSHTATMLPSGPASKLQLPSKRTRDSICGLGGHGSPFTIKPFPQAQNDKPHTFKPVRIIGRSQLPLSFLDTRADDELPTNRLFSAELPVLENRNEFQKNDGEIPRVLIARHEKKQTLYAIERLHTRVYSLCKLAPWLKEKNVADLWDPKYLKAYPKFSAEATENSQAEWWKPASIITEPAVRPDKRLKMSMLRPQKELGTELEGTETKIQCTNTEVNTNSASIQSPLDGVSYPIEPPTKIPPQEQLENFAEQYLNAVYMSRTSLAYFAKGPVTRIRAVFTSSAEGAPQTCELITFLRAMLLSHKVEEIKYTKKLYEIIKDIPPGWLSDDVLDASTKLNKPRKKKKKVKLSREGIYPQESEIIKRWWLSEMPNGETHAEETLDQRIKRRLANLRVREALAQMILMLEIVALEALSKSAKPLENTDKATESQDRAESQNEPPKRKKKLDDIGLRLDLLLDKLCIWQSIEKDGVLDFEKAATNGDSGMQNGNDRLQSFCVEVIVPFYTNRLPEQARIVNKKLGGPVTSTPKRKAMKPPTTSSKVGGSKEPDPKKIRRSLARVATDTTRRTAERRSLSRSATDSALLGTIKREGSEVPLSAIPLQRSPSQAARRSMSQFRHLQGREIDLDTTSAAAAAKIRQKKRVAEDLKEAITALKKPNRGLAAGSYADEIEKRGLGFANKARKPATTVRKISKDVQVSATPRAVRRLPTGIIEQTPIHNRNPFVRTREAGEAPSSDFCIPSSGARPSSSVVPATVQRSTRVRLSMESAIADTPSKPAASKTLFAKVSAESTIFATPAKWRALSPESPVQVLNGTPTKSVASPQENISSNKSSRTLLSTFTKYASKNVSKPCAPEPAPVSKMEDKERDAEEGGDIFDALGWNDDDDVI